MAQLTVRNLEDAVAVALRKRAAANGRSAEAEHRELLRNALLPDRETFLSRARALRERLSSKLDSADTIRADRDRDSPA